jgi:hypothetical protein
MLMLGSGKLNVFVVVLSNGISSTTPILRSGFGGRLGIGDLANGPVITLVIGESSSFLATSSDTLVCGRFVLNPNSIFLPAIN